MFNRLFKKVSTDKAIQISNSPDLKRLQIELDEMQLKREEDYEEYLALDNHYQKDSVMNSSSSRGDSYDVVDEDIDFRTLQALYASEGWFYIVVQAIVKAIISLPMKMEKKKITTEQVELPNGELEELRNEIWVTAGGEGEFDIFKHPNDIQTSLEFFMLIIIDLLSLGNCYTWVDRGEGGVEVDRPTARLQEAMRSSNHGVNGIYRMNPALMEPLIEEGSLGISAYGLMSVEGYIRFDASEILHIKMPHPGNPLLGLSPIVPVLKNVLIDRFTSEHMIRFYKQGARLGGVIKTSKKLTKDQITRLTRNFEANCSGKKNHHKTLILPEGMEYHTIEVNPGETSLIDFSKFNKEPILSTYSVPPVRVGLLDGATYANALIQDKSFWENAVKPIIMILEDGFSNSGKIIKRERRLRFGWDLSDVEALQENLKDKAEIGVGLVNSGWSIDEVREKHWKLPKLDAGKGGDMIPLVERSRQPSMNNFQLSAPSTDEKTQAANAQDDQETVTDITSTDMTFEQRVGELTALNVAAGLSPSIAAQEAVTRALEEGLMPGVPTEESTMENNEDPDNDTSTNEEAQTEEEEPVEDAAPKRITSLPGMDEEVLSDNVKALTGEGVDGLIDDRFNEVRGTFSRMESIFQDAAKVLTTDKSGKLNKRKHLIKSLLNKAESDDGLPTDKDIKKFAEKEVTDNPSKVDIAAMEVGHSNTLVDNSLTFPNEEALASIKLDAANKVVGISQTTKDQMRGVIAEAFSKQSTPQELADMIGDKFSKIMTYEGRAMTIARTETLTAVSAGQELKRTQVLDELPELGKTMKKAWLNAQDNKVRHSHVMTDDEGPIDHDEKFSNGLMYPREKGGPASEVINCRCTVVYFLESEQEQIEDTLASSLIPSII